MELVVLTDTGVTLEELVTAIDLDRSLLAAAKAPSGELRTHDLLTYVADVAAIGGIEVLLQKLERLIKYGLENGKTIRVEVAAFGVKVRAEWERRDDPGD